MIFLAFFIGMASGVVGGAVALAVYVNTLANLEGME